MAFSLVLTLKATACPLWISMKTLEAAYVVYGSDSEASPFEFGVVFSDISDRGGSGEAKATFRLTFAFSFPVWARVL